MITLDTNVLVYATDKKTAGRRHLIARDIVDAASGAKIAVAEQVLIEFINVALRKTKLPLQDVNPYVRAFLGDFLLLLPSRTAVGDVMELLRRYRLSVWDAHLVAVCFAHGCDVLLSEDLQDGARYNGLTVLNPFDSGNARKLDKLLRP